MPLNSMSVYKKGKLIIINMTEIHSLIVIIKDEMVISKKFYLLFNLGIYEN